MSSQNSNLAISSPSPSSIPSLAMELAIFPLLLLLTQSVVIPREVSAETLARQDELEASLQTRAKYVLLHPPTGECVIRDFRNVNYPLLMGPCSLSDFWYYSPQKLLMMEGTYDCLQVIGAGEKLKASIRCSPRFDTWEIFTGPSGKTQIMQRQTGASPSALCLEADPGMGLLSQPCRCLPNAGAKERTDEPCDVSSQWFEYHNENGAVVGK